LIDARAPQQSPFGAHIIKKQKQRDAARESRGEPDHQRDPDIYLCHDNERSESRTVRLDEGIEKVLIPGITVLRSEFEETGQFIRLCITVIAKEETDTQIHAGQNEKPLPFSYQLFAHGFCGEGGGSVTAGMSLLRNRGLAAKDILLDFAGGCFRQLGHKLDSLGTLEVRQMITSVIAQLGFRRGRACF
jgi:hypothetical protein